jgi:hypothetical protein
MTIGTIRTFFVNLHTEKEVPVAIFKFNRAQVAAVVRATATHFVMRKEELPVLSSFLSTPTLLDYRRLQIIRPGRPIIHGIDLDPIARYLLKAVPTKRPRLSDAPFTNSIRIHYNGEWEDYTTTELTILNDHPVLAAFYNAPTIHSVVLSRSSLRGNLGFEIIEAAIKKPPAEKLDHYHYIPIGC